MATMMPFLLSPGTNSHYALTRPRQLEPILDVATYSATIERLNSLPTIAPRRLMVHILCAVMIMILFCLVPTFRNSREHSNDTIDWIFIGVGIAIGFVWSIIAIYQTIQQQKFRRQQLQIGVEEIDREYQQLALLSGRPRICWSLLMNQLDQPQQVQSRAYSRHVHVGICCPHLTQLLNPPQQQIQLQIVAAAAPVPAYQPQQHQPQSYQQQQQQHESEPSTASHTRSSNSQQLGANYSNLENPLLR